MFHTPQFSVQFKHSRKNAKIKDENGEKKVVRIPQSTTCAVYNTAGQISPVDRDTLMALAVSKPVNEILIECTKNDMPAFLGRKIKKVYKLDSDRRAVVLPGDHFSYAKGRKESLKKAMEKAGLDREARKSIWEAYKAHCK